MVVEGVEPERDAINRVSTYMVRTDGCEKRSNEGREGQIASCLAMTVNSFVPRNDGKWLRASQ